MELNLTRDSELAVINWTYLTRETIADRRVRACGGWLDLPVLGVILDTGRLGWTAALYRLENTSKSCIVTGRD